jgi:hypothetical protein
MEKTKTITTNESAPPTFTKRIGRTTYEVSVHFNENARENERKGKGGSAYRTGGENCIKTGDILH